MIGKEPPAWDVMSIAKTFLLVTIPCGFVANALAIWVFWRLSKVGYQRPLLMRPREGFRLYKIYWKIAPEHGWSRWPLIGAAMFFVIGCVALLFST